MGKLGRQLGGESAREVTLREHTFAFKRERPQSADHGIAGKSASLPRRTRGAYCPQRVRALPVATAMAKLFRCVRSEMIR
jgi:hypothetical protein